MDGQRFDTIAKTWAGGVSRRVAIKGLIAGLGAALGLGARPVAAGQAKTTLCHATGDPQVPFVVIEVADPAWPAHEAHGDTPYIDCCLDSDCADGATCRDGACCTPTSCAAEGAECGEIDDGCGGVLNCGECSGVNGCGVGGPNVCGCTPDGAHAPASDVSCESMFCCSGHCVLGGADYYSQEQVICAAGTGGFCQELPPVPCAQDLSCVGNECI